jgi:adenine deaminase
MMSRTAAGRENRLDKQLIDCAAGQITTGQVFIKPKIKKGFVLADPDRDILKVAVIE